MLRMLNRFARDGRGGMAVMGAVIALPLAFVAFAAVEYHRVTSTREQLQRALDTATMAVALTNPTDPALRDQEGQAVLLNTLGPGRGGGILESATFTPQTNGDVIGQATLSIRPIIAHLLYNGSTAGNWQNGRLHLSARSEISRLGSRLEVALVLDNTYSMLTNNRLVSTKTAATNFVDALEAAANRTGAVNALKISVVPFAMTVKVGASTPGGQPRDATNSPWLDWAAQSSYHRDMFNAPVDPLVTPAANRFNLFTRLGIAWGGCVETRPAPYDVRDDAATTAETRFVPYFAPDESDLENWPTSNYTNTYIDDFLTGTWEQRQRNVEKYHQPGLAPASGATAKGLVKGPNYGCENLQPVLPLTSDMAAVRSRINAMTVVGDTNIPVGLAWGWHTLSPNSPLESKGAAYESVTKIAVLMTDGDNTNSDNGVQNHSLYSALGYMWQNRLNITPPLLPPTDTASHTHGHAQRANSGDRKLAMDARLKLLCTNMRNAGVVIYTIRFQQTGDAGEMDDCASGIQRYFDVQDAAALDATFATIAKDIIKMRVKN